MPSIAVLQPRMVVVSIAKPARWVHVVCAESHSTLTNMLYDVADSNIAMAFVIALLPCMQNGT